MSKEEKETAVVAAAATEVKEAQNEAIKLGVSVGGKFRKRKPTLC